MKKLKRSDPDFFKIIGRKGGLARKKQGADYSELAKLSHANRTAYHGGRPKGVKNRKGKNE